MAMTSCRCAAVTRRLKWSARSLPSYKGSGDRTVPILLPSGLCHQPTKVRLHSLRDESPKHAAFVLNTLPTALCCIWDVPVLSYRCTRVLNVRLEVVSIPTRIVVTGDKAGSEFHPESRRLQRARTAVVCPVPMKQAMANRRMALALQIESTYSQSRCALHRLQHASLLATF